MPFDLEQYAFNVAILSIFGNDVAAAAEDLKQCYCKLEKGYNSMPINLPGTLFHKAMKARNQLARIVAGIISSRRLQSKNTAPNDLLGSLMEAKEGLSDDQIADNVIGVIFAARDTTASVLTWIIKYLGDNPSILQAVTVSYRLQFTDKISTHSASISLSHGRKNKRRSRRANQRRTRAFLGPTPRRCL